MKAKRISITETHAACARMMLYFYSHNDNERKKLNIKHLCQKRFFISTSTWYKYRDKYRHVADELVDLPRGRQIELLIKLFEDLDCTKGGYHYLTPTEDAHLTKWVHQSSIRGKSPASIQVRRMAKHFRQLRYLDEEVDLPSSSWFDRFAAAHEHEFQYRTLKNHPISRASAEDPTIIEKWFLEELLPLYHKYNIISPQQVIAMDETGFVDNTDLHGSTKFLVSENVEKRIEERQPNYHYTVLHICTALGITLPPVTIFEGNRERTDMLEGAPEGTLYTFQQRGYMEASMMTEIVRHVIKYHHIPEHVPVVEELHDDRVWQDPDGEINLDTTRTKRAHTILLMDNASVHYDKEAMLLAEQAHIHICFLPPNLTHILQVSDLSCFALLKKKWYKTMHEVTYCEFNPIGVTQENFWKRLRPAWDAATTRERVVKGFEMAGQWPLDPTRPKRAITSLNEKTASMSRIVPASMDVDLQSRTHINEIELRHKQLTCARVELQEMKSAAELLNEQHAAKLREMFAEIERLKASNVHLAIQLRETSHIEVEIEITHSQTQNVTSTASSSTDVVSSSLPSNSLSQPLKTIWDASIDLHENTTPKRRQDKGPRKRVNKNILYPQHRTDPGRLMNNDEAKAELAHQKLRMAGVKPIRQTVWFADPSKVDEQRLMEKARALVDATKQYRERNQKKKQTKSVAHNSNAPTSEKKKHAPRKKPQPDREDTPPSSSDDNGDDSSNDSSDTSSEVDSDDELLTTLAPQEGGSNRMKRRIKLPTKDSDVSLHNSADEPAAKRHAHGETNQDSCPNATHVQSFHIRITLTPQSEVVRRHARLQHRVKGSQWAVHNNLLDERIMLKRINSSKARRQITFERAIEQEAGMMDD